MFEIAKRERADFMKIVECLPQSPGRFAHIKDYLLKRRYPSLMGKGCAARPTLSGLSLDPRLKVDVTSPPVIEPRNIFIEESVQKSEMADRVTNLFPGACVEVIKTYKEHVKTRGFSLLDYNRRLESFYLIRESYDFYKPCPCMSDAAACCGYYVVNLGSGCPFECAYCVLQDYVNSPGIVMPANIEDFFTAFHRLGRDIRCSSGELTDSLAFDHITGYSPRIVEFFRSHPKTVFEFKTKSDNVDLLASVPGARNIVVSWSVNPSKITETVEYFTAPLARRLAAAQRCVSCGYRVAFHFDPIVYYQGWADDYEALVNAIFGKIGGRDIAWISLGTLRMSPRLKKAIENRFPDNTILDEEFLAGHDGKLRYPEDTRASMYRSMTSWIRRHADGVPVYLCMENKNILSQ